jgi:hypothetical protein
MSIFIKVKPRLYQDSLKLMRVSSEIQEAKGITQAFAFMGTEINKTTRIPSDILAGEAKAAGADDLILMVESSDAEAARAALAEFDRLITESRPSSSANNLAVAQNPPTLDSALALTPDATVAVISVPGIYAGAQALRAYFLNMGNQRSAAKFLNVHYNTISYRMERIEQLTGVDFSNAEDSYCLQTALKLLDIINYDTPKL